MVKKSAQRSALKYSAAATALFLSSSAMAAGTWYDARNDAMGGTGVASSVYGSAVLANPALMTRAKSDDNVSIIIPSAGIQVTDKDKLIDKVDDITDTVDRYRDVIGNLTFADYLRGYPELRAASGDVADKLSDLRGNKADGSAGVAVAVTIPNETLPFAFITKAYGTAHVRANVVQGDIDYLRGVANGTVPPRPGDQNNLRSSANGLAALTIDYGVAVAHEFTIAGQPVSVGVTPKVQKTSLYNYTASIYNYDKNDINNSQYRSTDTGFNVDAGLATTFAENWTLGVTGQNLVSRDLQTKEVNGFRDTYQIRPLVTTGLSWDKGPFTVTGDVDLTETKRFKTQDNSQYAAVGAEYRVLDWLQLRAGYRADMRSNDENVATAGFGLSPFNKAVHLDLAGSVGANNTWGAMMQLGFNF
ncbi:MULTISPECIES: conjugal transfer protein TraF [Pantoea]|uniref:Conjugal transfer protein TraF n=2 Tax=Pantoea vagans TaxID=470934 RepID=A0ABY3LAM0_9GAMM|nr:conjugal transfer protein TraF [Pantoea sp. S62]MBK5014801.1 conjugal transfer protein TraF [Pantoea sp. S62]TXL75309.1 conjugal transfer protein TraF [Pantoea vagans]